MASPTSNFVGVTYVSGASAGFGSYLIDGVKWGGALGTGVTLTYSFPVGSASYYTPYSNLNEWGNWFSLSSGEQASVRLAMASMAETANVRFVEVADNASTVGELRFAYSGNVGVNSAAHAYLPSYHPAAGDVWLSPDLFNPNGASTLAKGGYDYFAILHEVGHALGLRHPFEASPAMPRAQDNYFYTIMSYTASPWSVQNDNYASFYPTTPMYYDLVALQTLYGRNTTVNSGNTTYTFNDGTRYWQAINDGGGFDTIVYNGVEATAIYLNPGTFSSLSEAIAFSDGRFSRNTVTIGPNVVIENASGGSGNDTLTGNSVANTLRGNAGNDTLFGQAGNDFLIGGLGADSLRGGAGSDVYHVDNAGDVVNESVAGSDGIDTVQTTVTLSLSDTIHIIGRVENLTLFGTAAISGTGNALANTLVGNAAGNVLSGLGGNDYLVGGGGADNMRGGAGSDVYHVDNAGDIVNEGLAGSDGIDTVQSVVSFNLSDTVHVGGSVEKLTLLGTAAIGGTGNALANTLIGNGAANVLSGLGGNDLISGSVGNDTIYGGLGTDTLYAGAGDDTIVFNTALGAGNVDYIMDFNVVADSMRLENAIFTALRTVGQMTSTMFWKSTTGLAHDADDRIVYDTDDGRLIYDSNGNAAGGSVLFADLAAGLAVTHADFLII